MASLDWNIAGLHDQLARYGIPLKRDVFQLREQLTAELNAAAFLILELIELEAYAQAWGINAGAWLVLAVTRMIKEILEDYRDAGFGCVPPSIFGIAGAEDDQQEIGHRCITAYQDIYHVLLRTHHQASSPIWHRRAVTQHFPQLILKVNDSGVVSE